MTVQEYFDKTPKQHVRPAIVCRDGFRMSVQASHTHYCTPRDDFGPYSEVEIGYPSAVEETLIPYVEDAENPTETVYGYVPVGIVNAIIETHGGIVR